MTKTYTETLAILSTAAATPRPSPTISAQHAAALQSVRDGADESVDVHDPETAGSVAYVRDRRGIVRVESGPDGQRISERVIERAKS